MNYRFAQQTAWRTFGDETIVLDLATKRMYGLNESASFVWRTLGVMESFDVMHGTMVDAASEAPAFGADDLAAFCRELLELHLIEEGEPDEQAPVAIEPPSKLEPPQIVWQETLEVVAASCAFLPAQNPLCNQVPMA